MYLNSTPRQLSADRRQYYFPFTKRGSGKINANIPRGTGFVYPGALQSFPNMPRTRYGAVRPLCLKDVQESLEFLGAYCEEKAAPRMMTTRRVFGGETPN